jgi:hypothetical protein
MRILLRSKQALVVVLDRAIDDALLDRLGIPAQELELLASSGLAHGFSFGRAELAPLAPGVGVDFVG